MTKPSEMPGWPDRAWYEEYFSAGMEHYERVRASELIIHNDRERGGFDA